MHLELVPFKYCMLLQKPSTITAPAFEHLFFSMVVAGQEEAEISHDVLDATIISSNFWPPIQVLPVSFLSKSWWYPLPFHAVDC